MDKAIPDAQIRRAWLDLSMTSAEAARSVGLSRTGLWARAKKLTLPARPEGRREVIPREILAPLWAANVCVADIAALYHCPDVSVSQSARRYGLPKRPKGKRHLISLDDYRQQLLGQIMARDAAEEALARIPFRMGIAAE